MTDQTNPAPPAPTAAPPPTPALLARLLNLLVQVPLLDSREGRDLLLVGIAPGLTGTIGRSETKVVDINNIVNATVSFGRLDDGRLAVRIVVENAGNQMAGSELGRELSDLATQLDNPPEDLAALRAKYAAYLHSQYDPFGGLKVLLPGSYKIMLEDIFVPPLLTVTRHQGPSGGAAGTSGVAQREHVELETLAADGTVVVILGDAGSGLSTVLRHYALTLLGPAPDPAQAPVPIMLILQEYAGALKAQPTLRLQDFAAQKYAAAAPELANKVGALFAAAQDKGQAAYLLHGLDAVPDDQRQAVSDQIAALAQILHPKSSGLLISSRRVGYRPLALDDYNEAAVEPFTHDQVATFVQKWYNALGKQNIAIVSADRTVGNLLDWIDQHPGAATLTDNPLTLTILVLRYFTRPEPLPSRRVALYALMTRTLIEDWREKGGPALADVDEDEILDQISLVAYWMHDERPAGWATQAELAERLGADNVQRYLDMGMLADQGQGRCTFSHPSIQEYLVARKIAHQAHDLVVADIQHRLLNPRWAEVISLAIADISVESGQPQDAADVIQNVILKAAKDDPYERYLQRNLLLAGHVLADDPEIDRPTAEEVAQQLFTLLLKTKTPALIEVSGAILAEMRGTDLWPSIMEWVTDAVQARQGVERLGRFAAEPAVQNILLPLLVDHGDGGNDLRQAVATALASVVIDPILRQGLLQLADPDVAKRTVVVQQMANYLYKSPGPAQNLLIHLLGDVHSAIRAAAAGSLARVADDPAVQAALQASLSDPEPEVRAAAARALAAASTVPAIHAALRARLADPGEVRLVRAGAAEALMNAPPDPTLYDALNALLEDPTTAGIAYATLARWAEVAALAAASAPAPLAPDSSPAAPTPDGSVPVPVPAPAAGSGG